MVPARDEGALRWLLAALERSLSEIPHTDETENRSPEERAREIARNAAIKAAVFSGGLDTMTLRSADERDWRVSIDLPEKALLRASEAALEYEDCGRDLKRYAAHYPSDPDAGHALFGYVRSESRLLDELLDNDLYRELLRIVRRHGPNPRRPVRGAARRAREC